MSTQRTPAPLRKPGAKVLRGLNAISSEMGGYADVKADEGKHGRSEASDIRAAIVWISEIITNLTGSATP